MIYCTKQSKKSKDILDLIDDDVLSKISNWELIRYKVNIQKNSQRQFFWYQIIFICFAIHMQTKNFDQNWLAESE